MIEPTPTHTLYRPQDPGTSRAAAFLLDTSSLQRRVAAVIRSFGTDGCISDEVRAAMPGLSYSSVTARFKALKDKGMIITDHRTRPGKSGRSQHIMWGAQHYAPPDQDGPDAE